MFSLSRCARSDWVLRSGFLFLLGVMALLVARAADAEADPPADPGDEAVNLEARQQAIEQFERLGQQVRESTSALIELIVSPDAPLDLRRRAVLALANLGPEDREQSRILFDILANPEAELELRRTIVMAFGEKDLFAPWLVPALLSVVGEPQDEPLLRRQALFALRRFAGHQAVLPALAEVLANPAGDDELRLSILDHLRFLNGEPRALLEVLTALVQNRQEPEGLRVKAIETLRGMGPGARPAASSLVAVLSEDNATMTLRLAAAMGLRQTGWSEDESRALVRVLFHVETPAELRVPVAELVGRLDWLPPVLASEWMPVLEDADAPLLARRLAARLLAKADLGLTRGLELSTKLLRAPGEDIQIRLDAGEFLRRSGVHAAPARETLEAVLLSGEAPTELREIASTALAQVAQAWLERPDLLNRAMLNSRLAALEHSVAIMEQAAIQTPPHPQNLEAVRRMRDVLRAEKASRWWSGIGDWVEGHPVSAGWVGSLLGLILGGILVTAGGWVMTRMAPLRLGRLHERLRRYEVTLPTRMGGHSFGLRHVTLLVFWGHHARVLDAWIDHLRERASAALDQRRQEAGACQFVDLPIIVDGKVHDSVPFPSILKRLAQPGSCVVIVGSAASGKTTLALQIANRACAGSPHSSTRHIPFLPVWIDQPARDTSATLLESVRAQLRSSPAQDDAPSPALLQALLGRGRIVLVLDGISERVAADRDRLMRAVDDLGVTSILVTARHTGLFAERKPTRVELPRLRGAALTRFVAGFLEQSGQDPCSAETDLLDACGYWVELSAGRGLTADGVHLFAEHFAIERGASSGLARPQNVLELVHACLRHRNGRVEESAIPDETVLRLAGQLAWTCAMHDGSITVNQCPESVTPEFLQYLEENLDLIRKNPRTGELRFRRQIIADHLAADHLIDTYGKEDASWQRLGGLSPGASSLAQGPLAQLAEAIWNVCFRLSDPFAPIPIPPWLHAALEQKLEQRDDRRPSPGPLVRQLLRLVLAPENPERTRAIDALVALGPAVTPAIPALLSAFRNASEDLEIRHAALAVLALLGERAASAAPGLRLAIQDRKEHLFLRMKAIDTLVQAAAHDPETVQLLVDRAQDPAEIELLRGKASQAAAALTRVGGGSPPASGPGSQARTII